MTTPMAVTVIEAATEKNVSHNLQFELFFFSSNGCCNCSCVFVMCRCHLLILSQLCHLIQKPFDSIQLVLHQGARHPHGALHAPVSQHGLLGKHHGLKCQVAGDKQFHLWNCLDGLFDGLTCLAEPPPECCHARLCIHGGGMLPQPRVWR